MLDALTNLMHRIEPEAFFGLLIPILGVIGGVTVAIVVVVSQHVQNTRKRDIELSLKHEMIARGMSADEIERVLAAKIEPKTASHVDR